MKKRMKTMVPVVAVTAHVMQAVVLYQLIYHFVVGPSKEKKLSDIEILSSRTY